MPLKSEHISLLARLLPIVSAVFAIVVGCASMIGWAGDLPPLLSWGSNDISIKFNASVCITLAGIALLLGAVDRARVKSIRLSAGVTASIASATLFQHISGINLGIDTLIFDEAINAAATSEPGRMGIPASLALTVIGLALVLTTFGRTRRAAARLAVFSLCIAALPLAGYLFGADQLFSIPRYTGIAFRTAAMIAVLSLGVIALVREHGLATTFSREDAGGAMFRRLALPLVLLSVTVGLVRLRAQDAGYFDTAFGTAARTWVEIVIMLGLLWWTAESLSRSEARSRDTARVKDENDTLRRIEVSTESERRRIARDMHDHIGQSLTALRLKLDLLQKKVAPDAAWAKDVANVGEHARKLDADISLLVWQMRPGVLDTHGLASALNSFVREWSQTNGIEAEFHATSSARRLPRETETHLYRIIQEALNNILKHANATKVSITMTLLPEEGILAVEDNGTGFDTEADAMHTTEGSGFGLIGMRERAVLVGGRLEVESSPGGGTAVLVRVPIARSVSAASSK